ncbi:hypothetical protein Tco_0264699 [Tanacetum coccineum]
MLTKCTSLARNSHLEKLSIQFLLPVHVPGTNLSGYNAPRSLRSKVTQNMRSHINSCHLDTTHHHPVAADTAVDTVVAKVGTPDNTGHNVA